MKNKMSILLFVRTYFLKSCGISNHSFRTDIFRHPLSDDELSRIADRAVVPTQKPRFLAGLFAFLQPSVQLNVSGPLRIYIADVIEILERRAEDEARLIFQRQRETSGGQLLTEISAALSLEINQHYARLFSHFQGRPHLCGQPLYRAALLQHLPRMIREEGELRGRIDNLPEKIRYAILASEIASSLVYRGDRDSDYAEMIEGHLQRMSLV
jgi:hypothetical protein